MVAEASNVASLTPLIEVKDFTELVRLFAVYLILLNILMLH